MISEIYVRDENDPNYIPNMLEFKDEVESIITQIRMIIGTVPGEVFGSPEFGFDIEEYIFRTRYDAGRISELLDEQLNTYLKHSDNTTVQVGINFGDSGRGYDYAVLDIYINGQKTLGFLIDKDKDENNED